MRARKEKKTKGNERRPNGRRTHGDAIEYCKESGAIDQVGAAPIKTEVAAYWQRVLDINEY